MTTYLQTSSVLSYYKASKVVVCSHPWMSITSIEMLYPFDGWTCSLAAVVAWRKKILIPTAVGYVLRLRHGVEGGSMALYERRTICSKTQDVHS